MKSATHELITRQIVEAIYSAVEGLSPEEVKHGGSNRWTGASGQKHQIDVSVRGPQDLVLIECKYWENRITVDQVLVFAGRVCDIRQKLGSTITIHPILVTKKGAQSGAKIIAKHFGVELCIVQSARMF